MSSNYKSSSTPSKKLQLILCAFLIFCLLGYCTRCFSHTSSNEASYTAIVTKLVVKNYDNASKFLVYVRLVDTGEIHVLQITDSFSNWLFDSSKLYDSIEVDKTYIFTVYEYKNKLLSEYENILSIEEVSSPQEEQQ